MMYVYQLILLLSFSLRIYDAKCDCLELTQVENLLDDILVRSDAKSWTKLKNKNSNLAKAAQIIVHSTERKLCYVDKDPNEAVSYPGWSKRPLRSHSAHLRMPDA